MNRDISIVRQIVRAVRDNTTSLPVTRLEGVDQALFNEHVRLLEEEGLIEASLQIVQGRVTAALARRLTAHGQEFAEKHL